GEVAAGDELGPPLVGLAPEEVGGLGDVAGLVEDEEGRRFDMVEARRRGELDPGVRCPGCGLADRRAGAVALEPGEVRDEALRQPGGSATEALAERGHALVRGKELRRGQQGRLLERADRALIGRIEGAQRVDLVAEELDPDREGRGRREDIDDPAASGELATPGNLARGRVAETEELEEQRFRTEPAADLQPAGLGWEIMGRDRVLKQALDARDEDPGVAAAPRREGGDPGGGLVGD